ncbi:hypothetical protein CCH79_00020445 [Gambusia affinis]|uniref:Uncharacterized protein n=1 Tax=Gambusia affinis TaxID=33528 RepID=A0A315V655_GAMAF|nr:hypothetical protein CCH79_00020445 [Gambusia affinis]
MEQEIDRQIGAASAVKQALYQFWAKDLPYTPGSKVCVLPERNPTNSWKQGMIGFLNKFICERDTHKIPPY